MPIMRVGVQAAQGSTGQIVDDGVAAANITSLQNLSTTDSVAYSTDYGATWTTVAAGGTSTPGPVTGTSFRMRRGTAGGYPIPVDINFTEQMPNVFWDPAASSLRLRDGTAVGGGNVPGVYIPTGWGAKWRARLQQAGSGSALARIAWVGDSVLAGAWCSDLENKNLPGLINAQLQAKYGDGGSGYSSSWRTDLILANAGYTPQGRWTLSGTWAANPSVLDGPGGNHIRAGSANATATKVVRGTTVIVTLFSGNSASFGSYTVTIDGVVQGSAVSTNTGTQSIIRRTFTGLSAGNHTVIVTATDANGSTTYLFLCGIEGINASGVVTHNYARGSYPSAVFNNVAAMSYVYTDGSTFGGSSVGSFGPAGLWSGGRRNPADLVVWGMGLNDARFGTGGSSTVSPDAFAQNLERFLVGIRDVDTSGNADSLNPNTEILLLAPHAGSPAFQGSATTRYYAAYCEQMRSMAEIYGCAFLNVWQMAGNNWKTWLDAGYFGTNAVGTGIAGTDAVHPSDAGFSQMAAMVSPYIVL